jgi:anti-anti-sigma regulatory factor
MNKQATVEQWNTATRADCPPSTPVLLNHSYRYLKGERVEDVFCVSLRKLHYDEIATLELAEELIHLITDEGCRRLVLSLGPGTLEVLYSVFLAKLVTIQRLLRERGGALKLCDLTPQSFDVFAACKLTEHFEFVSDKSTALAAFPVGVTGR